MKVKMTRNAYPATNSSAGPQLLGCAWHDICLSSATPETLFDKVEQRVGEMNAVVVHQFIFGGHQHHDSIRERLAHVEWPVTWIYGHETASMPVIGTQVQVIVGGAVRRLEHNGRVYGSMYTDPDFAGTCCFLGGLEPPDASCSKNEQTRNVFESTESLLAQAGMTFDHVVRTWLYLDRIHDWYGEFNEARTDFFRQRNVLAGLVPASTAIGAVSPSRAPIQAAVVAMKPWNGAIPAVVVSSPLQCAATQYKSSFSRAVEIESLHARRLAVSGTASIDFDGGTLHVGDLDKQIAKTIEVLSALIASRKFVWEDVTRMTVYASSPAGLERFQSYWNQHGLPPVPFCLSEADICRPDLLFEIELDACQRGDEVSHCNVLNQ